MLKAAINCKSKQAEVLLCKSIDLKPDYAAAHNNLGTKLYHNETKFF